MQYYWVSPQLPHNKYITLLGWPTTSITRSAHLQPYYNCDITGWAHQIQYVILLSGPATFTKLYYWVSQLFPYI